MGEEKTAQKSAAEAFKSCSRVLFGQEIGELEGVAPYLSEMMSPYRIEKSCISGKPVLLSHPYYPKGGEFVSQEEVSLLKFPPLSINEIKDIDSLLAAVKERQIYCGNKRFGTCHNSDLIDNCIDCSDLYFGHNVVEVKKSAYVSYFREAEHMFGVWGFPESSFCMRCCEGIRATRCFESYYASNVSDMYYAFNCVGCSDCMFAFNLKGKHNAIGNLELSKERFSSLKKKLLAEIAGELKSKKRIFSIIDVVQMHGAETETPVSEQPVLPKVEAAFRSASRLVLGEELKNVRSYENWLLQRALRVKKVKGAIGTGVNKIESIPIIERIPASRIISAQEAKQAGEKKIPLPEGELPTLSEVKARVSNIAYFCDEFSNGIKENCPQVPIAYTGSNCQKVADVTDSKLSGFASAVVKSEHVFGGGVRMLRSQFCLNCYDSVKLSGCLEVDCSYSTRNSYLCHNCENVQDSILCFNAKNMQYAIGNTVVGKEQFLRIKKMLLEKIAKDLKDKGEIELSVFSL